MTDCSTCTAWVAGKDVTIGRCKAHPPAIVVGLKVGQPGSGVPEPEYLFPITGAGEWCREHQPIAPPPPPETRKVRPEVMGTR